MADGTTNYQSEDTLHVLFIDAAVATDNGVWIDTRGYPDGSIDITIATTATVQVRGSDAAAVPAASAHGNQLGADITASGLYELTNSSRWLKVRVSSWNSGAVSVLATLRRRAK